MLPRRRRITTLVALVLLFGALVWLGRVIPRNEHKTHRETAAPSETPHTPESAAPPLFAVPEKTAPLRWHGWSDLTFAQAAREERPIVALIGAAWSESARLYSATLEASDARSALENDALAVRVDIDRRPDVHARFHVTFDTLPTLVFMTPRGRVWDVRDALPPARVGELIRELQGASSVSRDAEIALLEDANPMGPPSAAPAMLERVAEILSALAEAWPHPEEILDHDTPILGWDALGFLRAHAESTNQPASRALFLQGLRQLLASPLLRDGAFWREVEGGPERFSRARFLETHALLLRHFETAARWTNDEVYRQAAAGVRDFLTGTLWDETHGMFRAAQSTLVVDEDGWPLLTGEEFTSMRGSDHRTELRPYVVPHYPSGANARASEALLETGRSSDRALRVLETLWVVFDEGGTMPRDFALDTDGNLLASAHDFAMDYADVGSAFLTAANIAADPAESRTWTTRATALAQGLLERFHDAESHLFRDARPASSQAPERMRVRLTPLVDNARIARFLTELTSHTGDPRYDATAQRALERWNVSLWSRSVWDACEFGTAVLR